MALGEQGGEWNGGVTFLWQEGAHHTNDTHTHTLPSNHFLVDLFLTNQRAFSVFSSLFSVITVFLYPPTNVLKALHPLGKSRRKSQKSSQIGKGRANKVTSFLYQNQGSLRHRHAMHLLVTEKKVPPAGSPQSLDKDSGAVPANHTLTLQAFLVWKEIESALTTSMSKQRRFTKFSVFEFTKPLGMYEFCGFFL